LNLCRKDTPFTIFAKNFKQMDIIEGNDKHTTSNSQRDEAIYNEIKNLIEENGCSDKVSIDNQYKLEIKVTYGGTAFAIMYGFFETGECGIFLRQEDTSLGVGNSKSTIKKLAKTLGVRYGKPEYFLQILLKGDVDVVEEIKKIIMKMINDSSPIKKQLFTF